MMFSYMFALQELHSHLLDLDSLLAQCVSILVSKTATLFFLGVNSIHQLASLLTFFASQF